MVDIPTPREKTTYLNDVPTFSDNHALAPVELDTIYEANKQPSTTKTYDHRRFTCSYDTGKPKLSEWTISAETEHHVVPDWQPSSRPSRGGRSRGDTNSSFWGFFGTGEYNNEDSYEL